MQEILDNLYIELTYAKLNMDIEKINNINNEIKLIKDKEIHISKNTYKFIDEKTNLSLKVNENNNFLLQSIKKNKNNNELFNNIKEYIMKNNSIYSNYL